MSIREYVEKNEILSLSEFATKSINATRENEEEKCIVRTEFQKDRDRITHSKSFRRLMHKTQVFISPEGDHYRTRLTHTLEVAQISRTIARALRMNEDLAEAIALGHDLGHTPFGHTGEDALNSIIDGGFRHNEQSVRVVTLLENNGQGLNLTKEVIDGIKNHRSEGKPNTIEGKIVQLSDKIAYINHDIDDAIRAKVLNEDELPKECIDVLGKTKSARIDFLIKNVIETSVNQDYISLDSEAKEALKELRKFMFKTVYSSQLQQKERNKIKYMLKEMYSYYCNNTDKLPKDYFYMTNKYSAERVACDYIAGMTDRYALNLFVSLYLPSSWNM